MRIDLVRVYRCFIMVIFLFFLCACEKSHQLSDDQEKDKGLNSKDYLQKSIQPTDIEDNFFQNVVGWYDSTSLLYIMNKPNASEVIRYDIFTGESSTLLSTEDPIIQVIPNYNRTFFLVHTSPNQYKAILLYVDEKGNEVFKWDTGANELHVSWNPFKESQSMITVFNEDWAYKNYLVDVENKSIKEIMIKAPFVQWEDEQKVMYLKWSEYEPELSTKLYLYDLENKTEKQIANHVIGFLNSGSHLIYLEENREEKGSGQYVFVNHNNLDKLSRIEVPLISQYSQWLFPYNTISVRDREFYTFFPVDIENDEISFDLVRVQMDSGKIQKLIRNVPNEPITISPEGQYILYGYRFEKLIDLSDMTIKNIIQ